MELLSNTSAISMSEREEECQAHMKVRESVKHIKTERQESRFTRAGLEGNFFQELTSPITNVCKLSCLYKQTLERAANSPIHPKLREQIHQAGTPGPVSAPHYRISVWSEMENSLPHLPDLPTMISDHCNRYVWTNSLKVSSDA